MSDVNPRKLRIIIDIYEVENVNHVIVHDISSIIHKMFNSIKRETNTFMECLRSGISSTEYVGEVLAIDDVIGRQIRTNKGTYVIILISYKSLLSTEVINPWSWSRYWYGTQPTIKFTLNAKKAKDIRETAIFHFEKSKMVYNPYLLITDVDETNKGDTLQLLQDAGFSLSKIICISGKPSMSDENLKLMVRMIEMKFWAEHQ